MDIVIVSGFLGSGKTTLISHGLDYFREIGKSFALIVNEIGASGVDNFYFGQSGCHMREILGGCMCCTSAPAFGRALVDIRDMYNPDIVLIEPSGIANPRQIKSAVLETRKENDTIFSLTLLDSERIDLILDAVHTLTADSVEMADRVVITKIDIADPEGIDTAISFVQKYNPDADIVQASLVGSPVPGLMEEVFPCRRI